MPEKQENSGIFREKSINRVSGPEALNDYIRVTTPSVWIVLLALIILLVGMLTWSILGVVTVHDAAGNQKQIHPIEYVIN